MHKASHYALSTEGWCKHCHSVDHISDTSRPKATYSRKQVAGTPYAQTNKRAPVPASDDTICKKYNRYEGDCHFGKNCRFHHVCSNCKKDHPVSNVRTWYQRIKCLPHDLHVVTERAHMCVNCCIMYITSYLLHHYHHALFH